MHAENAQAPLFHSRKTPKIPPKNLDQASRTILVMADLRQVRSLSVRSEMCDSTVLWRDSNFSCALAQREEKCRKSSEISTATVFVNTVGGAPNVKNVVAAKFVNTADNVPDAKNVAVAKSVNTTNNALSANNAAVAKFVNTADIVLSAKIAAGSLFVNTEENALTAKNAVEVRFVSITDTVIVAEIADTYTFVRII